MNKRNRITFCTAIMAFVISACSVTFHGRVIDADTRAPIEGAGGVVSWSEERATIAGPTGRLKDVKETLTDKNGEWVIKGPKGRIGGDALAMFTYFTGMYFTKPPWFIVFKPGYCSYPIGFTVDSCSGKIKPGNQDKVRDGETVELPKLMNREDRLGNLPSFKTDDAVISYKELIKKQRIFIRLINEERRNMGLSAYHMKELENEK